MTNTMISQWIYSVYNNISKSDTILRLVSFFSKTKLSLQNKLFTLTDKALLCFVILLFVAPGSILLGSGIMSLIHANNLSHKISTKTNNINTLLLKLSELKTNVPPLIDWSALPVKISMTDTNTQKGITTIKYNVAFTTLLSKDQLFDVLNNIPTTYKQQGIHNQVIIDSLYITRTWQQNNTSGFKVNMSLINKETND